MSVPFDARGAFVGGLAGLSTVGALGLWASGLGNLAGYVVVSKIVGLLSVFGVSIGTGSAAAFVAAIGGPITLAVGIGIMVGWAVWSLTGQSWERRLAKRIVGALAEKDLLGKLRDACRAYWDASEMAFISGAAAVKEAYEAQKKDFESKLRASQSEEYIEARLFALKNVRVVFENITWPSASHIGREVLRDESQSQRAVLPDLAHQGL